MSKADKALGLVDTATTTAANIYKEFLQSPYGVSGRIADGLKKMLRSSDLNDVQAVRMPDNHMLVHNRQDAFSTYIHDQPRIWKFKKGEMFDHGDFMLSPRAYGKGSALMACDLFGGGCQYRGFANAGGLQQTPDEVFDELSMFSNKLQEMGIDIGASGALDASKSLMDAYAAVKGYKQLGVPSAGSPQRRKKTIESIAKEVGYGAILADTNHHNLGHHLVGIVRGKQAVPDITQLLRENYYGELERTISRGGFSVGTKYIPTDKWKPEILSIYQGETPLWF